MKKTTLLILLFISSLTIAQDFNITKSEIFKDKKKHSFLSFAIDDQDGGLITVRRYLGGFPFKKIKGYYIEHFDKDLKLKNEFDYEVDKSRIENAFVKDGKLHLIEFENLSKEDQIVYRALSTDINNFNFKSKELLSISEDNIKTYFGFSLFTVFFNNGVDQMDGDHLGEVIMSKNNKFFAINFDFKDKEKETHKIFVFNDNLEMVYDKLIVKDIKDRLFKYNSIDVDDQDGSVYFLGKSFENNSTKKKKKGKANYHFELSKINKNGEKIASFKNPDKFIGSLSLVKNNGKISCVGFYGNKDEGKYNGACLFNLNPTSLALDAEKYNPFSETFLSDKYGDREGKKKRKKKKGLTAIKFRSIEAMPNGDLVINAEEDYITTHTTFGPNGTTSTTTVQHYDDIISLRLNNQGDLKWARNINKAQTGYQNSSFTPISVGEKTYFFINCSDKLKKLRDDRIQFKQTSAKNSNLYAISIDGDGAYDIKKLIDKKDSKVYYKVNNGIVSDHKNEVILLGKRKKDSQVIKINI
ncbi:hypothetical protein C7447_10372 [Tenacibaculum adriaticum]|uniref:Uncharacterized protein n=1 Tax=Tenacibaculum adriaticum TaxID=413713 RepID=A0A5S5DSA6_9FLAO|nr:hypothetical protein [Tenacibaculum adriaticum]TYP97906.1 hypothetical protein C7447_10372 [Tenacibaculum adriaticum]